MRNFHLERLLAPGDENPWSIQRMCQWPASVHAAPSLCSRTRSLFLSFDSYTAVGGKLTRAPLSDSGNIFQICSILALLQSETGLYWPAATGGNPHGDILHIPGHVLLTEKKPKNFPLQRGTVLRDFSSDCPSATRTCSGILWYQPLWLAGGQRHAQKGEVGFLLSGLNTLLEHLCKYLRDRLLSYP